MASPAARCRASASNWTKWWTVSAGSAPGRRPLPLRVAGRPDPEGWEGGRLVNVAWWWRRGSMPKGSVPDPGVWTCLGASEDRRLLAGLPAVADRSGPQRGPGNLRCSPGAEERHGRGVRWGQLATLPHPLHGQPAHPSSPKPCPTWLWPPCSNAPSGPATVSRRGRMMPIGPSGGTTPGALCPALAELLADAAPAHPGLRRPSQWPTGRSRVVQRVDPQETEPGDPSPH